MCNKHKNSAKKRVYKQLLVEKANISKAKALRLDKSTIDIMIALYLDEVDFFKEHYSE